MSLLVIRAQEIRNLLPMDECIQVMHQAMRSASSGGVRSPPRIIAPLGDASAFFILMPGSLEEPQVYGAKIVSLRPGNPVRGRPAVQGFVTLFDGQTGTPMALLDGAEITRIRTAAASAMAAQELAREDASSHGIFGAGVQAVAHLESIACVREIAEVLVWARDAAKAQQFADEQAERTGLSIRAVDDRAEAAACDIVSVLTNSPEPVLRGDWLQPGAHVSLVGAHEPHDREADSYTMTRASIYVDSKQGALRESGDILIPISEGRLSKDDITGEIGEVLLGTIPGRTDEQQITLYKSLGIVAQDLFAAEYVLRSAQSGGAGKTVRFP